MCLALAKSEKLFCDVIYPHIRHHRFLDLITLTAISISVGSLVLVIVSAGLLRRQVTMQHHMDSYDSLEISAIVSEFTQRLKRLEESLIDQKVKLEISELRAQRSQVVPPTTVRSAPPEFSEQGEISSPEQQHIAPPSPNWIRKGATTTTGLAASSGSANTLTQEAERRSRSTERDALRIVLEGRGKTTAKEIQARIGRTREHTARMMNSLFHEGYVERDVRARPFAYSITEKVREFVKL